MLETFPICLEVLVYLFILREVPDTLMEDSEGGVARL